MSGMSTEKDNLCGSCLAHCQSPQSNQVASESVHGAQLALKKLTRCESCLEESTPCKRADASRLAALEIEQHSKPTSSFAHSVINMIGMLLGLGQLSTPYALENGGWASVFLLIGLGILCAYTSHIMGKCLEEDPSSKTYEDIAAQAFGTKGRIIAATFIYLQIFFSLVSYTISLSDNLPLVFGNAHIRLPWPHMTTAQILTVIAVLLSLPSLWLRNLSSISFLSFGGIIASLLIFMTVALTPAFHGASVDLSIPVLQLQNIPSISGIFMFSYAGHIVFPNIYTAMKDPSKFTKVSITSFTIAAVFYMALGFIGASLYGPTVNSQITLSMPRHLVITKIALWATVLTPMTKYALQFAPFAIQLEHSLPPSMGPRTRMLVRGSIGSAILLVILALALSVPYFEYVLSLTGSFVSVASSVILPCAFYLKVCRGQVSKSAVVLNAVILVVGVVLGAAGTISSSKSLIQSIQRGHPT